MSNFNYKAGLHSVGNYQVSGVPYVTASLTVPGSASAPMEIIFPSVTQKILIHNHDASNVLRVGFSSNGVVSGSNYWVIDNEAAGKNSVVEMRVKTDKIFLLGHTSTAVTGVFVMAELTGITLDYNLAASYSGSNGVG